jgi:hypothetical protein
MPKAYQDRENRQAVPSAGESDATDRVVDAEHEGESVRVIDLGEVEIDDGPSLARLVTSLRRRAEQGLPLMLVQCPQMLAHTLYKAGVLGAGRIRIASVREEEPRAS